MITTANFPQADRLEQVGKVATAIFNGHQVDAEIENFIGLNSGGRQGRYYRLAAEALGLIFNQHNYAVLTSLGKEYVGLTTNAARMDFLARCLVDTPVFHEALRYIHKHKPSDRQLKKWFRSFYPGAQSTADRRFHTFISYMRDAGLLQQSASSNQLQKYIGTVVKKYVNPTQGLTGRKLKFTPTHVPTASSTGVIHFDVDAQKRERANLIHWQLVDAKSSFLFARDLEPYANNHIDLFTDENSDVILYEMKSVNSHGNNLLSQVRKAISQLYEYRYIYQEPKARLCIVTNHGIAKKDDWLLTYLANDRSIAYVWTHDFANFECHDSAKPLLGNFAP
ncbi:hypothetical protein HV832_00130 [Undibacterium oligocarboniphilum]|uniref:DUF7226 domain-containing protein n=1 Tax=Undibacterium oligocarboniphilum TaxID=666702 RepID=A0A850QFR7_9BURK|nr:hypothetical protein [Undibacterium oligocarboniphilum]NVO76235.1 hypothetical protein [Undibacterium oligocarboniphilum]